MFTLRYLTGSAKVAEGLIPPFESGDRAALFLHLFLLLKCDIKVHHVKQFFFFVDWNEDICQKVEKA